MLEYKAKQLLKDLHKCPIHARAQLVQQYLSDAYYYGSNNSWWIERE